MGVRGLRKLLEEMNESVDLVSTARLSPMTIIVDFYAFVFYILETFVNYDPETSLLLDSNALLRYEFCELTKLRAIVWTVVQVLKQHHVSLSFLFALKSMMIRSI